MLRTAEISGYYNELMGAVVSSRVKSEALCITLPSCTTHHLCGAW